MHVWQNAWQKGEQEGVWGEKGHYSWNSDAGLCSTGRLNLIGFTATGHIFGVIARAYIWIIAPGFHLKQRQLFHFKRWLERTNTRLSVSVHLTSTWKLMRDLSYSLHVDVPYIFMRLKIVSAASFYVQHNDISHNKIFDSYINPLFKYIYYYQIIGITKIKS